ncbi:MAG: argininosuccinate synthase [bacterium]
MQNTTNYLKASSYEAKKGEFDKVLLLYSGGLDTSVMIKWLMDNYQVDVYTLTMDVGQQKDDLEEIKAKALKLGAKKAFVVDAKADFANAVIAKGIKANASYQGNYHLSTPMGRVITSMKAVEFAEKEGIQCIAHGSTGKGNDQVRFESYVMTLNSKIKIIAPVREWNMDRNEEIAYAIKNGIPVPVKKDFPYSVDDNMWGMTWEGGEIETPKLVPPVEKFLTTYTLPEHAPDQAEVIEMEFKMGLPVKLNGESLPLAEMIIKLNKIAGKHGVGITYMLEDRLVGVKNRGVYELPAGHVMIKAHKYLEQFVSTQKLNEMKEMLDIKWAYMCYSALWFDPLMEAINAFNDKVNEIVEGVVTLKLYKGTVTPIAVDSKYGLANASFNNDEGYNFNVNASAGFIEIYSLQMKEAYKKKQS